MLSAILGGVLLRSSETGIVDKGVTAQVILAGAWKEWGEQDRTGEAATEGGHLS